MARSTGRRPTRSCIASTTSGRASWARTSAGAGSARRWCTGRPPTRISAPRRARVRPLWRALPKIVFSKTLETAEGNISGHEGVVERSEAQGAARQGHRRRRRRPGFQLHRAGPRRRVPPLRARSCSEGDAVLPGGGAQDRPGAGRDAHVRLARRLPALPARLDRVASPHGSRARTARSPSSPARARASGWRSRNALVDEGARVVAGARTTDSLEGIDGVTAVRASISSPPRARRSWSARARRARPGRRAGQQRRAPCGCASRASWAPATRSSSGRCR